MARNELRIGARGSALSLIQARMVEEKLKESFPMVSSRLVVVKTKGDRILDAPLSRIGGRGVFTRAIEEKLLSGEIDAAVHSLKDLPTQLPPGLVLGGVLERGEAADVLISRDRRKLEELPRGHAVGTSSMRRRAQILRINPELRVVDIRGNVETRIQKMERGVCSALLLAAAGVERAGYGHRITQVLDPEVVMPGACQGIIGVEVKEEDGDTRELMGRINHRETYLAALAERAFLRTLEGGCQVPAGCFSSLSGDRFTLRGFISSLDGTRFIRRSLAGSLSEAPQIGRELGAMILREGGDRILEEIRGQS